MTNGLLQFSVDSPSRANAGVWASSWPTPSLRVIRRRWGCASAV